MHKSRRRSLVPNHSLSLDDDGDDNGSDAEDSKSGGSGGSSSRSKDRRLMNQDQNGFKEGVVRSVKKRRSPGGDVWVNEFKRVGRLGKGSYGEVFKV
jgi:hypothetical protein